MVNLRFEHQFIVDSTNNVLKNDKGKKEGDVIIANEQTDGKGMGANTWESAYGENITGSIVFEPTFLKPVEAFLISMAVSCGIIKFLSKFKIQAEIKWPNDIYIGNKKIAGILIENEFTSRKITRTIAGIGFNVNQTKFSNAPNPISLIQLTGKKQSIHSISEELFQMVYNHYELLRANKKLIMERYHSQLFGMNQWLLFENNKRKFSGKIKSVAEDGQILIVDESRVEHRYYFKEVEFII